MTCDKCGEPLAIGMHPFCPHGYGGTRINGDECDYIDHNLGPEPIRITSWSQRKAIMDARGLQEMIRYVPTPEGAIPNPQGPSNWAAYRIMDPEYLQWIADRLCSGKPAKDTPHPDATIKNFIPFCEDAR